MTLNDLCDFINGGAWSDKEYSSTGIPVLKVSNLQNDGIDFNKTDYLPESSLAKYSKHILRKGDLVIATVGSHPNLVNSAAGRASIIAKNAAGYLLNQNAVCLRTKDNNVLDQFYLAYTGKTSHFQHYIQQRGRGAANQMRIAIGAIKEYELVLPSIKVQRKLASILSAYDDLIENNLKRIKLLEELAQRTYEEWFVKFRINGEALAIDEETGLPEGWERKKLRELIGYEIGGGWGDAEQTNECPEPGYVIRGTDIDPMYKGNISNVPFRFHKKSNMATRKIQAGDIIFEVSGGSSFEGVAKSLLVTDELLRQFDSNVMCASFCKLVRPARAELSNILFLTFKFFRKAKTTEIWEIRSASNIVNYNWTAFLAFQKTVLPSERILIAFNEVISPLYKQLFILGNQNNLLKQSRDILLPRLMNGTISVEEAEESIAMAAEPEGEYLTTHNP